MYVLQSTSSKNNLQNQIEIASDPLVTAMFCEANAHVQNIQNVYAAEGTEEGYQKSKKV